MQIFKYKAANRDGEIVKGLLEAADKDGVAAMLQEKELIPIKISPGRSEDGNILEINLGEKISSIFIGISTKDVMLFTKDLSTLLESGLPLDRALSILIDVTEKIRFKEVIKDILKSVQGGSYLPDALARYPRIFPGFYVNMVRAGEAGGVLEAVLVRLAVFLENSQELKDYIKSSLVYPVFLLFVGGISIIILLTFVIPKFSIIFSDMGQTIPLSTRFLLGLSGILKNYWWLITAALVFLYVLFVRYQRTPSGRLKLDTHKISMPIVGKLTQKIETARFARTMGTLMKSGVPILQALKLVKDIIVNRVVAESMVKIYESVKEGEKLSKPLGDAGFFPSLAIQMITVGEETGRLDEMLLRVADNYEKIVKNTVKRFISLLEPVMILVMGVVVGFIVISMLMAIFGINDMPF
ncbi:MAG: type II secretion system protein GspF [Deltaproteobacteria bacterium]|nr:MAG: type II secretion system protein GspF [Deltaproteobacteria bacterium]